ncbi:MAG: serine/threonine protein kinase, partial [Marinilabiliales bacterium]
IEAQRDEIESQRDEVQFQKGEIEDSILYAKRIQTAVIPSMEKFESFFKSHFVIFKPHSVVSGDFYWITQVNEWIIATVVDCTGHGVPGAFMSMLGVSFLNEIVRKKEVTNAASVLNHLRDSVIEALQQSNSDTNDVRDGMDMSLVAIHEGRKKAFWAGANNPLWIVRHSETEKQLDDIANKVEVIKGDAMPVSIFMNMRDFTNHEITLNEKDRLYLFSDGFSDQFGGPKGKKYLNKSFRRLIAETSILPMKEQGKHVEIAFDEWGTYGGKIFEQVDDVTVLGLEI